MSKLLVVAFNPSLDKTVCVDRIVLGREIRAKDVRVVAGGKAINVARTLKTLNIDAGIFGIAAGTTGRRLEELLNKEGLSQEWVWSEGETRTNLTLRERPSARATRILEAGPRIGASTIRTVRERFSKKLSALNAVIFSGSLPPGLPSGTLAGLVRSARQANVLTALDTSGAALAQGLKARPFLVKPNRAEAEEILGFGIRSQSSLKKALQYFSKRCNIVLISLGKDGLAVSDTVRMFRARGPVVRRGLTVGCGDATLAGFLAGFLKGDALEECLRLAVACGAANVGADIPGAVSRRRVKDILARIKVERL